METGPLTHSGYVLPLPCFIAKPESLSPTPHKSQALPFLGKHLAKGMWDLEPAGLRRVEGIRKRRVCLRCP